jgi:hypothetical protein
MTMLNLIERNSTIIYTPRCLSHLYFRWLERHRNPVNFALHVIGIPATIVGFCVFLDWLLIPSIWAFLFAQVFFIGGYLLQFFGHWIEGTETGELLLLRHWLSCARRRQTAKNQGASPIPGAENHLPNTADRDKCRLSGAGGDFLAIHGHD